MGKVKTKEYLTFEEASLDGNLIDGEIVLVHGFEYEVVASDRAKAGSVCSVRYLVVANGTIHVTGEMGTAVAIKEGVAMASKGASALSCYGGLAVATDGGNAESYNGGRSEAFHDGLALAYDGGVAIAFTGGKSEASCGGVAKEIR